MEIPSRHRVLQYALLITGVASPFLYVLTLLGKKDWGWDWDSDHNEYEVMLVAIYVILGVFLIIAARDPEKHLSLIWFTIASNVVHGGVMAVQAIIIPGQSGHIYRDVPALLIPAAALALLTPWRLTS